jgi:hypothetical protein
MRAVLPALSILLFAASCANDQPTRPSTKGSGQAVIDDVLYAAITRCGLSEGEGWVVRHVFAVNVGALAAQVQCIADCIQSATADCAVTKALVCTGEPSEALRACADRCYLDKLPCADGKGSYLGGYHCNGTYECADHSDENGCIGANGHCDDGALPRGIPDPASAKLVVCDGKYDCADNSDEAYCADVRTDCGDGTSLGREQRCDGQKDCPDGRDEADCTLAETPVKCPGNERPLPGTLRCDGVEQCSDGADERTGCATLLCPAGAFVCSDGTLVSPDEVCDGTAQCKSGEDESVILCADGPLVLCDDQVTYFDERKRCDRTADCPDGSDERGCPSACVAALEPKQVCDGVADCTDGTDEQTPACNPSALPFQCDGGSTHLASHRLCDGSPDCQDGADEADAACAGKLLKCDSVQRVPLSARCNGKRDCSNGEDEANCTGRLQCGDGSSVLASLACNGAADCRLGTDEVGCPGRFHCYDGPSILMAQACDGVVDCTDESDESRCLFTCSAGGQGGGLRERCNGTLACTDGSDEAGCAAAPTQFKCLDGTLLPLAKHCDLLADCADHSDEICDGEQACPDGIHYYRAAQLCNGTAQCPDGFDESMCAMSGG